MNDIRREKYQQSLRRKIYHFVQDQHLMCYLIVQKKSDKPITKAVEFNLHTDARLEKRKLYDEQRKLLEQEEKILLTV
ncbi:hypothetical protein RhiirC2_843789 [Rhizophagus irregularis]|uniref:Uncharacterized protein n=1 Tax=Rhizophagus irregularis TaxID=588596 RepID=A0A2N1NVU4_9GLOM|nr:hypothetical protein RhiirC2_843789 [Rhizophagus irregularis]